jgi:hypothetical protein
VFCFVRVSAFAFAFILNFSALLHRIKTNRTRRQSSGGGVSIVPLHVAVSAIKPRVLVLRLAVALFTIFTIIHVFKEIAERKPGITIGHVCHRKESRHVGKGVFLQVVPLSALAKCILVNGDLLNLN